MHRFTPHPMIIGGEKPGSFVDIDDHNYRTLNIDEIASLKQKTANAFVDLTQSIAVQRPLLDIDGLGSNRDGMLTDKNNGLQKLISLNPYTAPAEITVFLLFKFIDFSFAPLYTGLFAIGASNAYAVDIENATGKITSYAFITPGGTVDRIFSDSTVSAGNIYLVVGRYSNARNLCNLRVNRIAQTQTGNAVNSILSPEVNLYIGNHPTAAWGGSINFGRWTPLVYNKYLENHQVRQLERTYYNYYGLF